MDQENTINASDDQTNDQPWLFPMPGENARWFSRFSKYVEMGPLRSIYAVYASEIASKPRSNASISRAPGAWYTQARLFDWRKRAAEYDSWRRKEVFAEGLAQDTVRVQKLVELGTKMYEKLMNNFDDLAINDKFVAQLLAVFDLIAKHVGGYAPTRLEHTGKGGGKIELDETQTKLNVFWYMPQIEPLPDSSDTQVEGLPDDSDPDGQP